MKTEVKKSTNYKKSNIINKFYIDNSEKLSELIKNKVFPENIPDDIIYDIFKSKYSDFDKSLKLHKKARGCFFQIENIKYYFLLTKPDLIDLYHSYLKKQEEIIELRLHIKIIAIANSKGSCFIDVQSFLKNDGLPNDMQVEILNDNIIKITISTKNISEERLFIEKSKKRIENIINIYSYVSKIGLRIFSSIIERIPRGMISISFGNTVQMYHAIKFNKIQRYLNLNEKYNFLLKGYNDSLCEINHRAKVLTLWGIVEDIFFNNKANLFNSIKQSVLDKNEKSKIKTILKNINISDIKIELIYQSISKLTQDKSKLLILDANELITFKNELQNLRISNDKFEKIYQRICELKLNDRNSVIATNISAFLNEDLNAIKEKVRSASRYCGKQRHTTEESAEEVLDSINFLQSIIEKCIDKIYITHLQTTKP